MSGATILVEYSCHECGVSNKAVVIREREPSEDLMGWLEVVQREVGTDHERISPRCSSRTVELKIPLPSTQKDFRVGEANRQ